MWKKLFLLQVLASVCLGAQAQSTSGMCGDNVEWTLNAGRDSLRIFGAGPMYDYEPDSVPWRYTLGNNSFVTVDSGITRIGNYAFSGTPITNIQLPPGLLEIGNRAFGDCPSFLGAQIPESVTDIGAAAFIGCRALRYITLPSTLKVIRGDVFHACHQLSDVQFPDSLVRIEYHAFNSCWGLSSLNFPERLEHIGSNAFFDNNGIRDLVIPNSVSYIGDEAFYGCNALNTVVLPDSLEAILFNTFFLCIQLKSVVIPEGCVRIDNNAFAGCYELGSVSFPESLDSISYSAFMHCRSLTSMNISNSVTYMGDCAFKGCTGLKHVILPENLHELGANVFGDCTSLKAVEITGADIPTVDENSFNNPSKSELALHVPEEMVEVYRNHEDWKDFGIIRASIPGMLLHDDAALNSLEVTNGALTPAFNPDTFDYTVEVENTPKITLTATANSEYASVVGTGIHDLAPGQNTLKVTGIAGDGSRKTYTLNIYLTLSLTGTCGDNVEWTLNGDSLSIFGAGPVYDFVDDTPQWVEYNKLIKSVSVEEGVTAIGVNSFMDFESLTSVSLPEGITTINRQAFKYCVSLKTVVFPKTLRVISHEAFRGCPLESVIIPDSVTEIGERCFSDCKQLEFIRFPRSIRTIYSCFQECPSLKTVQILNPYPVDIEEKLITDILPNNPVLYVPAGSLDRYRQHPGWGKINDIRICDPLVPEIKSNAILTSIHVTNGVLRPKFDPLQTDYKIEILDFNKPLVINGTPNHDRATVKGDITVMPVFGIHTVNLNVLSEDSTNNRTYSLTYSVPAEGMCGNNVKWFLQDSLLHITGTGQMYDWEHGTAPWYNNRSSISRIIVSEGVTSIGDYAFIGSKNLKSAVISQSVATIGDMAFSDCSGLQEVFNEYPLCQPIDGHTFLNVKTDSVTLWVPEERIIFYKTAPIWEDFGKVEACVPVKSIKINRDNFEGDVYLTVDTGETFHADIFPENASNKNIIWKSSNEDIVYIKNGFPLIAGRGRVTLTASTEQGNYTDSIKAFIGAEAYGTCGDSLMWYFLDNTLLIAGTGAVYDFFDNNPPWYDYHNIVKSLSVEEGVTTVGAKSFASFTALVTVSLPQSVTSIEEGAFNGCENLTKITLPEKIVKISARSFSSTALDSIIIPEGVTVIENDAFNGCKSLKYVLLPQTLTSIGNAGFRACEELSSIIIPPSVTFIEGYAFEYCYGLKNVTNLSKIPQSIDNSVFLQVDPDSVTLYVPFGCKERYGSADVWKDFGTIIELEDTNTGFRSPDSNISISYYGRTLHVNTPQEELIKVYGTDGRLISKFIKPAGDCSLTLSIREPLIILNGSGGWYRKVLKQ